MKWINISDEMLGMLEPYSDWFFNQDLSWIDELSKKIFQISSLLLLEEIFITGFNRSRIRINIEINLKAINKLYHFLCARILYK